MLRDTIGACRSYRRYLEKETIDPELLRSWVDAARLVASSGNAQPLRYKIVVDTERRDLVFACLAWAHDLPTWSGPAPQERPSAYIVICHDENRALSETCTAWDEGIAAQTIMLQATESGYGGCMIASVKKRSLARAIGIDDPSIVPDLVLALGKPAEEVHVVDASPDGSTTYWRDAEDVHHVPKRSLADVLL